jgi:predicted XRE-type DNA-binding protein
MNVEHGSVTPGVAEIPFTVSSGNVFADLGVDKPAEALLKAELALQIGRIIDDRGLTQTAAAKVLGVDQPKVSALLRGRLAGFSIDRLVRFAATLGQDVEIVLHPREHDGTQHELHASGVPATLDLVEEPAAEVAAR